ncbi:MAG TPA: hypothetical protein PK513_04995 [Alphaproteobacteria bacterium]|nr:hypothetical protein [Alphaproteobacteria bacterium]USO05660.1 MAG: hypothetical protein H6859_00170 [Rhodospirillales bacterium]HOO81836.1 hypothetical protein [Alphaproteobacteria bacterium]
MAEPGDITLASYNSAGVSKDTRNRLAEIYKEIGREPSVGSKIKVEGPKAEFTKCADPVCTFMNQYNDINEALERDGGVISEISSWGINANNFDDVITMAKKGLIPEEISDEVNAAIAEVEANQAKYRIEDGWFGSHDSTAADNRMELPGPSS